MRGFFSKIFPDGREKNLANFASGIFENDVRKHSRVRFIRQVRAETDANIKRPVEVQVNGRAELVHRFAGHADVESKLIAALFNADALGIGGDKVVGAFTSGQAATAADTIFHILNAHVAEATIV